MRELDGKVAIITGSAHPDGQGAKEAARFVEEGATVVLADVDDERGRDTAEALGEAASYASLDVGDVAAWRHVAEDVVAAHGRVDVLVNNAGMWLGKGLLDTEPEEYRRLVDVNQMGVFLGMREVAPRMRDAGGGAIVNVGSNAAINATVPYWRPEDVAHAYTATKWAVRGMTKAAAYELSPYGIRVNAVHPGITDTPMVGGGHERLAAMTPFGRLARPEEIAEAVVFLASERASYVSGADLTADGASTA